MFFRNMLSAASRLASLLISRTFPFGDATHPHWPASCDAKRCVALC